MSQDFNFRFDDLNQDKSSSLEGEKMSNDNFDIYTHIRNLCLIWPDNKKKFLNFSYMVSGDYNPDDGSIILLFTTNSVLIKGSNLEGLFEALINHLPKRITCTEGRYKLTVDKNDPIIDSIEII